MGNKGALIKLLKIKDDFISIFNCHLCAGYEEYDIQERTN